VSAKTLKLLLSPEEVKDEAVYPQLDVQVEKAKTGEGRRVRRQ